MTNLRSTWLFTSSAEAFHFALNVTDVVQSQRAVLRILLILCTEHTCPNNTVLWGNNGGGDEHWTNFITAASYRYSL